MRRRPAAAAAAVAGVLALLLSGCAEPSAAPPATPTTPPTAAVAESASPPASAPATSAEASAEPTADWQRVATENGLVSLRIPTTWTVEHGGETIEESLWAQTMLVRNSIGQEMAILSVSEGGDRGGACGADVDGVFQQDDDGMLPARIHAVEVLELGDELDAFGTPGKPHLVAATVEYGERFGFHVGFLPEPPQDGLVPCLWYDDVAVPAGFPNVMLGTPPVDTAGDIWLVDSFEAGEAYTETSEFATLMSVMRSIELHP